MSFTLALVLPFLVVSVSSFDYFCGSNCYDYVGTCFQQGYSDNACIICARTLYKQVPDSTTNTCIINNQTQILAVELKSPISLAGFSSSTPVPFTCGSWQLSGKYVEGSYLSKIYQTPAAHYMVVLRYNLLFMGASWSTADVMTVSVDSNVTKFNYKCSVPSAICTTKDCPKIGEIRAAHNVTNATVIFTSSVLNTSGSSWGISNLIVAILTCYSGCDSCFGPSPNQCLSCTNNSYLLGNTCVKRCPVMSIPKLNLCAAACPGGFYPVITTNSCSPCSKGCSVCTGPLQTNCVLDVIQPSLWEQQEQFWVFLIVLGGIIVSIALVYLVIKRRRDKISTQGKESIIQDGKSKHPGTEQDMQNTAQLQRSSAFMNDEVHANQSQSSSSNSNSNSSDEDPKAIKVRRKWRGKQ